MEIPRIGRLDLSPDSAEIGLKRTRRLGIQTSHCCDWLSGCTRLISRIHPIDGRTLELLMEVKYTRLIRSIIFVPLFTCGLRVILRM